ncbi:MAG: NAD(P)H-dependent oxidoreductase [Planctomycetaceae bacterium]|nr:NAD(P)H-dependent oxidoreductase [Planctomycetaceae bacterium]
MSAAVRILALAGSVRVDSFNKRLLRIAADGAREAGAEVTLVDLKDYPLPLFDEDLEAAQGSPALALQLKQLFLDHHALLIASPEYNSSITPVLKNALDWVSRRAPNEPRLAAYQGKVATLCSASPGALGGLRGLVHLRAILGNVGVIVLPEQIALPKADEAFASDGALLDAKLHASVKQLGANLAATVSKLRG